MIFGVGQSNVVIQIYLGLSLVVMVSKFAPTLVAMAINLRQTGYNNEAYLIPIHHNRPLLPFEYHATPNGQDRDCKISMARYLRN